MSLMLLLWLPLGLSYHPVVLSSLETEFVGLWFGFVMVILMLT